MEHEEKLNVLREVATTIKFWEAKLAKLSKQLTGLEASLTAALRAHTDKMKAAAAAEAAGVAADQQKSTGSGTTSAAAASSYYHFDSKGNKFKNKW